MGGLMKYLVFCVTVVFRYFPQAKTSLVGAEISVKVEPIQPFTKEYDDIVVPKSPVQHKVQKKKRGKKKKASAPTYRKKTTS